jgi:hypothetical protein
MSEINPFYTPHRSSPISMFVDNSLPAELMLKAGLAKQAEQDKILGIVNAVGAYDQNAIKGGDTAYVDQTKTNINKFVDENNNVDFTDPTNQSKAFQFVRGIQQDKKLKQIQANYAAVQAYREQVQKLQAEGNLAFLPSVAQSERTLQGYINSGRQGEDIGALGVQKALNLRAKEETYVDNLKANGNQYFTDTLAGMEGLIAKKGWGKIDAKDTNPVMQAALHDYMNSPEGGQAGMLYEEAKQSGTLPDPSMTKGQYLLKRLYDTAKERHYSVGTVAYEAGLSKDLGRIKEEELPAEPIVEPGATFDMGKTSVAELKKIMNDPNAPAIQKQRAQAQHDAILNVVTNSPEGKAIQKTLTSLLDPKSKEHLPSPAGKDFMDAISKYTVKWQPGEKEAMTTVFNKLSKLMPDKIKTELLDNKNLALAEGLAGDKGLFKVVGKPGEFKGIQVEGTDKYYTWKSLGLTDAQAKQMQKKTNLQFDLNNAGSVYEENVFWSDSSSKIRNGLETWYDKMDEMGEGTSAKPMYTSRPATEKEQNAMKTELGSANPNLFEAVDKQNNLIKGADLQNLLANVGDSDISIRPSVSGRAIEITRKVKEGDGYTQKTFWIQEKGGVPTQTFDRLFQAATGNQTAGMNVSASDKLYKEVSNTPVPLVNAMGDFRGVLPAEVNPKLTVAKDRSGKGMYVLGDEMGSFTNQHVIDKFNQLKAIGSNQATLNKYQNIITSTLMSEGIPVDKIATYYTYLATGNKEGLDSEDMTELNNALDNKFSADGYNNMIFVAGLMSLKN